MTPAFSRWLESVIHRHRKANVALEEWKVGLTPWTPDVGAAEDSLRAMGCYACAECGLWQYADAAPRVVVFRAQGRTCLRCSGIPTPELKRRGT